MLVNRSMPASYVIPVLPYISVEAATDWLCCAFGFTLRWRVGSHRAQLNVGIGCVVVTAGEPQPSGCHIMVRVDDADAHYAQAISCGAEITAKPNNFPYGERQYSVRDPSGYAWKFSQSIADIDPASWGAEVGILSE